MKKKILFLILILFLFPFVKVNAASISYQAHVQEYGWMNYVNNDEMAGTTGRSFRLEALKIKLNDKEYSGGIEYSAHVQEYGWMNYVSEDELAGTTGRSFRLEAIRIRLTGELAEHYDIYYQAHVQEYGWMNYVSNDEIAGTTGRSFRLEALRIKLVKKDNVSDDVNTDTDEVDNEPITISYSSAKLNGNFDNYVSEGISGTTGQGISLDRVKIKLNNYNNGNIMYQTYDSTNGWSDYTNNNNESGKKGTPIEAIKIKLTDELAEKYNVFYRVHVSNIGWMGWTDNDSIAGTIGCFEKIEAIEIKLEPKGSSTVELSRDTAYREISNSISYSTHVQEYGWMDYVNEGISGTTGRSFRVEALKIKLDSKTSGSVKYQTYIDRRGWSSEAKNDEISGTTGLSRNLEAIKISLDGNIKNYYDIYYRTHVSNIGWLSWAKNGAVSGALNSKTQIEAIEIKLVKKGTNPNLDTSKPSVTGSWNGNSYIDYFGRKATGFRLIDGVKYYFNEEGTMYGKNVMKVVDVSSWQDYINWDVIKKNDDVDGAIIRVGWGTTLNDDCGLDSRFDYNIQNLQRLNIPYGVYIYGYSEYESSAVKEANFVLDNLRRYNVPKDTYIWYDAELDIAFNTYRTVIPKFVETIKAAGYKNVGVYSSVVRFDTSYGNLNDATIRSYPIWVAQYYKKNQYSGEYKGWQFQSDGIIDGINGNVDVNMFKK